MTTKHHINREFVRGLKADGKQREYYDDRMTGFGVRIMPAGSIYFIFRWTRPKDEQNSKTRQGKKNLGKYIKDVFEANDALAVYRKELALTDHVSDSPVVRAVKHERRVEVRKVSDMPTLREYLTGDYRTYWLGYTQSETPEANLNNIRRDFPDLPDLKLNEITRPMLLAWVEKRRAAKYKPAAINRTIGALGAVFSHAVEHEKIEASPVTKKLRQKVDPVEADKLGRQLEIGEEQRLRATLDQRETDIRAGRLTVYTTRKKPIELPGDHHAYVDHVKPAILLAINTGMRRSELMRLRWTAINWTDRTVTVEPWTTKVKKARVIDLNAEALAVLKAWRRQTAFEFVFANELGERMLRVRHWDDIRAAAKIAGFRFMDTRHHTATRMINLGASVYAVQKVLGHSDSRMTQRYLKLDEQCRREALALLDQPRVVEPVVKAA
jgi:integrase